MPEKIFALNSYNNRRTGKTSSKPAVQRSPATQTCWLQAQWKTRSEQEINECYIKPSAGDCMASAFLKPRRLLGWLWTTHQTYSRIMRMQNASKLSNTQLAVIDSIRQWRTSKPIQYATNFTVVMAVCSFYVIATSKVLSERVHTCIWAHSGKPYRATSIVKQYPTQLHYPDTDLASPFPTLVMQVRKQHAV